MTSPGTIKKFLILSMVFFLWGLFTSTYAQSPEKAFIPERFLPEDTLAICVFTNLQKTVEAFKRSLLFEKFLSDTHIVPSNRSSTRPNPIPGLNEVEDETEKPKTVVTPAIKKMQQDFLIFIEEFRQNAGFHLSDLWAIFHKSIAIAVLDISPEKTIGTNRPYPKVAFIADVTESAEVLKNVLETTVVPGIQAKEPTVEFVVESFEGRDVYLLANKQFQVYYTFFENAFVLALDLETIQEVLSVSTPHLNSFKEPGLGTSKKSLFDALPYRSVVKYTPGEGHEARIYVDIRNIWRKLRPYIRQICSNKHTLENTIVLDMLDQYNLQSLFWTFSYKDRGGYERLFFRIDSQGLASYPGHSANSTDLLSVLSDVGNGVFTSDQIVPANVLYYGASRVNLLKIWQQLSALINASSYPPQVEQFNSWVKRIEDAFQLDLEKELLMALDQEIAFACYAGAFQRRTAGTSLSLEHFPGFVLLKVNNREILDHAIQKIVTSLQIESRKEIYKNTEIHSLSIPGQVAPLSVYTAFVKDFLLVSVSRTMLQEIITVSQQGRSLATAQEYRKLSVYFPTKAYSKGYINIKELSALVRRFLNQVDRRNPSFQADKSTLPLELTTLTEQLSGMMWVTTVVNDGFLTESFSPVGGTVTGIAIVWLGLSLLQ